MKSFKQKEGGYYGDPFMEFVLPIAVVVMVLGSILAVLFTIEVEPKELSPGVYAISGNTVCEQVEGVDGHRCTITLDVSDQYGADEIQATNHVLMLEPGEEYAETVTLVEEEPAEEETDGAGISVSITIGDGGQEDDATEIQP